ncbi:MAG TPA: ABC transporter permease [Bryobacteraceae bacterium]|jgi:predicted permease|nr:ABC transporter permease [Bryobacteraceae bacterium]
MSLLSRLANVFRRDRLSREIEEELASHIEEAIEQGRDRAEARRAFGSTLRQREASRDVKVASWLDSLRADAVFGCRQLRKTKIASAAVILSLALAIGSCTAAFRLIDALLLRPLPVKDPARLYVLLYHGTDFDGIVQTGDGWMYPMFRQMRGALKDQAELIAISPAAQVDLTYGSAQETERAYLQYVSGGMFNSFGLRPAAGRLLVDNDDRAPGAHPFGVLSYEYWTRRFGRNPKIVGRTFRYGHELFTIVGVAPEGFTGTEPGVMTDIFVPTMMSPDVGRSDVNWFRTLVRLKPDVAIEPVRERLQAVYRSFREEQVKGLAGFPKRTLDGIVHQKMLMESASAGISDMQEDYRDALTVFGVLVGLVLFITCANVANLMTAQASARAREMALRVAIGAGRSRLVQLVLVESAMLALFASVVGVMLSWWSAPFIVSRLNPPDHPARLLLPADWRVLSFAVILTLVVALLFGIAPALRASAVKPSSALKGGPSASEPHSRRRLMHLTIAVQVALCVLVLFVANLLVTTLERLTHQPLGFSADRILTVEIVAERREPPAVWDQLAERMRSIPGIEKVALADWPLMSEHAMGGYISVDGNRPSADASFFLDVSPGWTNAMQIPFLAGRDFQAVDVFPKVAIVNETFAKQFLKSENPIGRTFATALGGAERTRIEIVGMVRNARYVDMRGPMAPVAYFPFRSADGKGELRRRSSGALIVRTSNSKPLALASVVRAAVLRADPEFHVSQIRTQEEIDSLHTMQERLLAMLALFFAAVALLLAGVGLYGVLDYSVFQRRREIGIRMAIGAQALHVAGRITLEGFAMMAVGAVAGLALGMVSMRYIESLLYQMKAPIWECSLFLRWRL